MRVVAFFLAVRWAIAADPELILRLNVAGERFAPWVLWIARHNKKL